MRKKWNVETQRREEGSHSKEELLEMAKKAMESMKVAEQNLWDFMQMINASGIARKKLTKVIAILKKMTPVGMRIEEVFYLLGYGNDWYEVEKELKSESDVYFGFRGYS